MEFPLGILIQAGDAVIISCKEDTINLVRKGVVFVHILVSIDLRESIVAQSGICSPELTIQITFRCGEHILHHAVIQSFTEYIENPNRELEGQHLCFKLFIFAGSTEFLGMIVDHLRYIIFDRSAGACIDIALRQQTGQIQQGLQITADFDITNQIGQQSLLIDESRDCLTIQIHTGYGSLNTRISYDNGILRFRLLRFYWNHGSGFLLGMHPIDRRWLCMARLLLLHSGKLCDCDLTLQRSYDFLVGPMYGPGHILRTLQGFIIDDRRDVAAFGVLQLVDHFLDRGLVEIGQE